MGWQSFESGKDQTPAKLLRWRLRVLMGLVVVVALGIKAVLVVQARRDPFESRFPGQFR